MPGLPLVSVLTVLTVGAVSLLGVGAVQTSVPGQTSQPVAPPVALALPDAQPAPGMRFGIDAGSVQRFTQVTGSAPDYGTVWVGRWNVEQGWKDTDKALVALHDEGVTPAIHFWYWGDDMSPSCFTVGCNGKDTAHWQMLADQLGQHLQADLQGAPALVVLESEFNKHGVHESEDLDGMLADKATGLKQSYPAVQVVLGLGDWYPEAWPTWDRAAAACDFVGLQALAASTQGDTQTELDLANQTLAGAQRLQQLFGKPIVLQDVAVSSYPEPDHLETQQESLARFAATLPALQGAGVQAVLYRSFLDIPNMPLSNHFAEAERHWGLAWSDTGQLKPAGQAWVDAIEKARLAASPMVAPSPSSP